MIAATIRMDECKKMQAAYVVEMDHGMVPKDLTRLVSTLRTLEKTHGRPFPPGCTDVDLARAAYFSKGPKKVLALIETLYDLRAAASPSNG